MYKSRGESCSKDTEISFFLSFSHLTILCTTKKALNNVCSFCSSSSNDNIKNNCDFIKSMKNVHDFVRNEDYGALKSPEESCCLSSLLPLSP